MELDLPGQLEQEIVGYPLSANSPYLRRGVLPTWARPTLVVRDERILSPAEAEPLRQGDYIYLLAPPERAQALDRFFVDLPPPARPDPRLLGDFFVTGDHTLGELAEIYGLSIAPEETAMTLADFIASRTVRTPKAGDIVPLGADRAGGAAGDGRPRRDDRPAAGGRAGARDAAGDVAGADQAGDPPRAARRRPEWT